MTENASPQDGDGSLVDHHEQHEVPYVPLEQLDFSAIFSGLCTLALLQDDMFLCAQTYNLQIVDEWTTRLEYQVLSSQFEQERTPAEAHFLNAQSQMWIMAAYEVLRTWRQLAAYIEKLAKEGALQKEIDALRKDEGYFHPGKEARVAVLQSALKDPQIVERIVRNRKRLHVAFRRIEAIRINLAKNEERGKKNSIAHMPGYGRINTWCGSLDYELSSGRYILGTISRRDIADSLRALAENTDPPDDETLATFDQFMREPGTVAPARLAPAGRRDDADGW